MCVGAIYIYAFPVSSLFILFGHFSVKLLLVFLSNRLVQVRTLSWKSPYSENVHVQREKASGIKLLWGNFDMVKPAWEIRSRKIRSPRTLSAHSLSSSL